MITSYWVESLLSNRSSSGPLVEGILTIDDDSDSEDGESGSHPINTTSCGNGAELHGGLCHGTLAVRGLGGRRTKEAIIIWPWSSSLHHQQ
jgi:hypothetical protein